MQNDELTVQALINKEKAGITEKHHFKLLATGEEFDNESNYYIGWINTIFVEGFVFHIFEVYD